MVITTALIGGVIAPKLITAEMVDKMKPGSVIVDLAAAGGGNCTLTRPGETVDHNGVRILAPLNLPSEVAFHGSLLYSRNLTAFVLAFWKGGVFALDLSDDILKEATITHDGKVIHRHRKGPGERRSPPVNADLLISHLWVFLLATFVGLLVIRRVSPLLHTPLMSLTNAISAIAVVGSLVVAGRQQSTLSTVLGTVAVTASMINIVGGYLITYRMLSMFRKGKRGK